jgi:glyoxylase-like metal-dependent hydrolase (beta-lactamase superfamily II)
MITGAGGNIGVSAGEDGILLVDDQFAELYDKIKEAISKIQSGPIRFVLNTNWHYDHVLGNEPLGKAGALIIAHEITRKRMAVEQYISFFDLRTPASPEAALPVMTFTDSITLHLNDEEIHAFHIKNAHSDADIAILFRKANVIHTGDLYFSGGYPFIDVPHGGSTDGMIAAADIILEMIDENTKVIPGHGPLSNREELQGYRDMLATVKERIFQHIKEGKTLEEIIAAKPTADLDKKWSEQMSPEAIVKIVYNDLSKR